MGTSGAERCGAERSGAERNGAGRSGTERDGAERSSEQRDRVDTPLCQREFGDRADAVGASGGQGVGGVWVERW